MQTDPTLTLSLKLTDRIPIQEIKIDTEANAPGVASSNFSSRRNSTEIIDDTADERLISQLKEIGLYKQFLKQTTEAHTAPSLDITVFYLFCPKHQIKFSLVRRIQRHP